MKNAFRKKLLIFLFIIRCGEFRQQWEFWFSAKTDKVCQYKYLNIKAHEIRLSILMGLPGVFWMQS